MSDTPIPPEPVKIDPAALYRDLMTVASDEQLAEAQGAVARAYRIENSGHREWRVAIALARLNAIESMREAAEFVKEWRELDKKANKVRLQDSRRREDARRKADRAETGGGS